MSWQPNRDRLEAELELLGVESTRETRQLLGLLATEPHVLYGALTRLGELEAPDDGSLPDVDRIVQDYLGSSFPHCSEPSVLRKTKPISRQCKRLLSVLLRDLRTPVPLAELLLANGLRSATPRRLRELQLEHGGFRIEASSRAGVHHYTLQAAEPDAAKCSRYWIMWNLRQGSLAPAARALAMLSAYLGTPVPRDDLDYLTPARTSRGPGQPRQNAGEVDGSIAELRARGYEIETVGATFTLVAVA